jgi:hypothetical protein
MNEVEYEKLIDRRVQARLSTDRDYLFAENAEIQALAERKIELQEEHAVLTAAGLTYGAHQRRGDDIRAELEQLYVELRNA